VLPTRPIRPVKRLFGNTKLTARQHQPG